MALTTAYLTSVKNVTPFFDSLIGAKAPEAFTQKFIEGLGFTSTNDRLFISVLKGLGFLDQNAVPTETYYKFLDQSESKRVLAEAVEQAYGDLFAVKKNAQELSAADVKNKLKTLTLGKFSDDVVTRMASTFKALCEYAEWGLKSSVVTEKEEESKPTETIKLKLAEQSENVIPEEAAVKSSAKPDFHYNIQIHLPDSRDEAVYDAIFKSLKKHIL